LAICHVLKLVDTFFSQLSNYLIAELFIRRHKLPSIKQLNKSQTLT